jgi:DNA invertase Pin-like site-specific DNA recombinase
VPPSLPLSGYIRVSQVGDRNGDGFISPEVQEQAIRSWSERNGVQVVIEPHELNVSGGTMERPVFGAIMEKVRAGNSGGIAVYKLDRFARNLLGAISTLAELGEHGAVLASVTEPELDYTTPAGHSETLIWHSSTGTVGRRGAGPGAPPDRDSHVTLGPPISAGFHAIRGREPTAT